MRIKWANVLAVLVGVPLAVLAWKHGGQIARFFGSIGSIGPGYPRDEQQRGLVALGVVIVALLLIGRWVQESRAKRDR